MPPTPPPRPGWSTGGARLKLIVYSGDDGSRLVGGAAFFDSQLAKPCLPGFEAPDGNTYCIPGDELSPTPTDFSRYVKTTRSYE